MNVLYAIKKNEMFVKEFSEGTEFTRNKDLIEYYTIKWCAVSAAREYGRRNGGGYSVVEVVGPVGIEKYVWPASRG